MRITLASHSEQIESRRASVAEHRIIELLRDRLLKVALNNRIGRDEFRAMARSVADRSRDPYSVVEEIIARLGITDH